VATHIKDVDRGAQGLDTLSLTEECQFKVEYSPSLRRVVISTLQTMLVNVASEGINHFTEILERHQVSTTWMNSTRWPIPDFSGVML